MKADRPHHVAAIAADIEANPNPYARLPGLRPARQGLNADDFAIAVSAGIATSAIKLVSRTTPPGRGTDNWWAGRRFSRRRRRPGNAVSRSRPDLHRAGRDPNSLFAANLGGPDGVRNLND
jgi:catechol 2,3-dioxygenase-like lactoylglutathione lyase family enzyme